MKRLFILMLLFSVFPVSGGRGTIKANSIDHRSTFEWFETESYDLKITIEIWNPDPSLFTPFDDCSIKFEIVQTLQSSTRPRESSEYSTDELCLGVARSYPTGGTNLTFTHRIDLVQNVKDIRVFLVMEKYGTIKFYGETGKKGAITGIVSNYGDYSSQQVFIREGTLKRIGGLGYKLRFSLTIRGEYYLNQEICIDRKENYFVLIINSNEDTFFSKSVEGPLRNYTRECLRNSGILKAHYGDTIQFHSSFTGLMLEASFFIVNETYTSSLGVESESSYIWITRSGIDVYKEEHFLSLMVGGLGLLLFPLLFLVWFKGRRKRIKPLTHDSWFV